jgi:hypothetical protein
MEVRGGVREFWGFSTRYRGETGDSDSDSDSDSDCDTVTVTVTVTM